jgi:hypothetical protein
MRTGSLVTLRLVLRLVSRLQCERSVRCSRIQRHVGLIRFLAPLLCLAASLISFSLTQLRLELEISVSHVFCRELRPWTLYAVVYTIPFIYYACIAYGLFPSRAPDCQFYPSLSPRAFAPLYFFSALRQCDVNSERLPHNTSLRRR